MKKSILSFKEYINEQESNSATDRPETDREAKSRIAASLVKSLFGNFPGITGGVDSNIKITKEVKESLPYKGCGATEPYKIDKKPISLKAFKILLEYLQSKGVANYTRVINELKEKRAAVIGFRNKLDVKKEAANQDRFTDSLYFIPQNAKDDETFIPYQITTSPSLAYYGNKPLNPKGTGIKLPGDTLYYLQDRDIGHGKYKMMVEGESIKVGRYPVGVTKFDTYAPSDKYTENCGMQIHRSSTKGVGICVGPWSGGCQVFADVNEFNDFINKAQSQTNNSGKFFYGLIQLDDIPKDVMDNALKGIDTSAPIASTQAKNKDKKEATTKKPSKTA